MVLFSLIVFMLLEMKADDMLYLDSYYRQNSEAPPLGLSRTSPYVQGIQGTQFIQEIPRYIQDGMEDCTKVKQFFQQSLVEMLVLAEVVRKHADFFDAMDQST